MKSRLCKRIGACIVLLIMILMSGCGNNRPDGRQSGDVFKQEDISYTVQAVEFPGFDSFDGAWSDGTDLYYIAGMYDQTAASYQSAFYLYQDAAAPEMLFSLPQNHHAVDMALDGQGYVYYLGYEESSDQTETAAVNYVLGKLDKDGMPLLTLDLTEAAMGQSASVFHFLTVDDEGHIAISGDDQTVYVFAPDGSGYFEARVDGWIFDMAFSNDKMMVGYREDTGMAVREIDVAGRKLTTKLSHSIPGEQFTMAAAPDSNLLIATEESAYRYSLSDDELVKKLDWQTYNYTGMSAPCRQSFGIAGGSIRQRIRTADIGRSIRLESG